MISDIKNEINESEKLRTEAKNLLNNAQKKLDMGGGSRRGQAPRAPPAQAQSPDGLFSGGPGTVLASHSLPSQPQAGIVHAGGIRVGAGRQAA